MSKIDYSTPRFTLREAAAASGFEHNTLRAYFQRGAFRIIGGERGSKGVPSRLNLLDVLVLAVAQRLRRAGVDPEAAFQAGVAFAHSGDADREPGRLYSKGFTVLIYKVESRSARVQSMGKGDTLGFNDLFFDQITGGRTVPIPVLLNDVEHDVFSRLSPQVYESAEPPARENAEPGTPKKGRAEKVKA